MKQFRITRGKGFHLPIGDYILSVQFGYGNYCNNYGNDECIDQDKTVRCENAEVAILNKNGGFATQKIIDRMTGAESIKDKMQDEYVIANATPDEVQQIIERLITLDNLKKAGDECLDDKKERTFGDIYRDVCKEYPGFAKHITDWRPIGPYKLQFWLDNDEIWHYHDDGLSQCLYKAEDVYLKGEKNEN